MHLIKVSNIWFNPLTVSAIIGDSSSPNRCEIVTFGARVRLEASAEEIASKVEDALSSKAWTR